MLRTLRLARIAVVLVAAFVGCGDDGSTGNQNTNQNQCPEGHQADGPACVPIFDDPVDCPGPNEMPVLGGGCRAVGVTQCATGFLSDGEGGCEPLLPDHTCPPGTMERIGQTACQPVGVTQCATGFVADGEGGCDAVLPAEACPPGTLEVIGYDTCQPLGDCGPEGSPWGLIEVDASTVYVDAAADATGADGTSGAPYPTVAAALAAVEPGGQVAIAAGEYEEVLTLSSPVRLEGRCAARVTLRGRIQAGQPKPALRIPSGGTGSAVRGVTMTGPGEGLLVMDAQQVVIEDVEVRATGSYGVDVIDEAEVTLRRVKLTGCTTLGIRSEASALLAVQTVVRGTLPLPGASTFGWGIGVGCTEDSCGSLVVDESLVTDNRDKGIISMGVETTIRASVVRDTLPRASDQAEGRGISVECQAGACGSLLVEGSLVTGNRQAGIASGGVATTIRSSVIRGNLPQEVDQSAGCGVTARCYAGSCAGLWVESSVISGNRDLGLFATGVPTTVRSSVVRDTLPQESDQTGGRGIVVQCEPGLGACGSLEVEDCLVAGNRDLGVLAGGTETTVRSSVVRDTLPQESDRSNGRGIVALCHEGTCEPLLVERSLVTGNRQVSILAAGVETTVRSSVVRDTLPQERDLSAGAGIGIQCDEGSCGSLLLEGSLVTGSREVGIVTFGADTTVRASVVRDTHPRENDRAMGRGIEAGCYAGVCGSLAVEGSLVMGNRHVGIIVWGLEATIRASVVRDTHAQESDQSGGRGINAQCDPDFLSCGNLSVEESLVSHSQDIGVLAYGVPAALRDVVVLHTAAIAGGAFAGEHGEGIWALCDSDAGECGTLSLTSCLVASSRGAGLAVDGVSGFMTGSVVDTVLAQPKDDAYGFGVQIGGREGEALPSFHIRNSALRDARLAGVLYYRSQGTLSGSTVSGGEYCVAMNEGSSPTVAEDNKLTCDVQSDPEWVSLYPSPAPPPASPLQSYE